MWENKVIKGKRIIGREGERVSGKREGMWYDEERMSRG